MGSSLPFAVNDSVNGQFTFESSTPDSTADENIGTYENAVTDANFTFGSYSGSLATGESGDITLRNDWEWAGGDYVSDFYVARGIPASGADVNGNELDTFNFQLRDDTLTMLSTDDLLTSEPSPYENNNGNTTFLILQFEPEEPGDFITSYQVRATVDSVTSTVGSVPEPNTIALLGLGLAVISLVHFRKT